MKKLIVALLVTIGIISMIGCSATPKTADKMYIEPAQLTEEEEKIAALLGLNTQQKIYDFEIDEDLSLRVQPTSYYSPLSGGTLGLTLTLNF